MFKIGDFSRLCQVSIRMLRHYDDMGLLRPESTDAFTGYRYYSASQLYDINRIQELKAMGFGLKTIKEILSLYDDSESLKEYLSLHYSQVREEAMETERRLTLIKTTMERLERNGKGMEYNVTLKKFAGHHVASMRKVMPRYEDEGELWGALHSAMTAAGVKIPENCYVASVFYDEGFKESGVDVEVQMSVTGDYADVGDLKFKDTEVQEAASTILKGSYTNTAYACEALGQWISDNGYEINGNTFTIYLNNPNEAASPDDYVSEVCFPVRKKK